MIVIESASDSKLWIDVGVNAGFRYGDAIGLSIAESECVLSLRSWEVCRTGDLAGAAVRVCLRSFLLRFMIDPASGDGALVWFVEGKSESRGDEDAGVGDVALRCKL
jgi:hypothetical protein